MGEAKASVEAWPKEPGEAVEQMMTEYGTVVLRTAVFILGERVLAEDVSQDVFVRAFKAWPGFRGRSSVKTWLTRITINLCHDVATARARERPADPALLPTPGPPGSDELGRRLERTELLRHLLALPTAHRETLFLRYYLDLDTREISRATGVAEGTARGRLHRGRSQLREVLAQGGWNVERNG